MRVIGRWVGLRAIGLPICILLLLAVLLKITSSSTVGTSPTRAVHDQRCMWCVLWLSSAPGGPKPAQGSRGWEGEGEGEGEGLVLSYSVRSLERCTSYLVNCLGFNPVLCTWPLMLHKVAQHLHKVVQHLHTEERLCISSMY